MKAKFSVVLVLAAMFGLGLLSAQMGWVHDGVTSLTYAVESGHAHAAQAELNRSTATSLEDSFELAATAIEPSVVSITSTHTMRAPQMQDPSDSPFGEFFGNEPGFRRFFSNPSPHRNLRQMALGSGVIISTDGYVLTNNHVVDGADKLTVQLSDKREFEGRVIGTDSKTDLAVIKIDAKDLVAAQLGDSESLRVGQWVMAAGSPFGLRQTVSAGIISAKGRNHVGLADYEDFLQTDAAINPGNSGGPLINLKGQVIGINTAIASRSGGFQGIGFAIPINMAHQVMDELIKSGKVTRSYLGVVIQELSPDLASSFGFKSGHGILVAEVAPDGPAAKAGFQAGDIITGIDGHAVSEVSAFRNQIAESAQGRKVDLQVWRDGKTLDINVKLQELPASALAAGPGAAEANLHSLGVQLVDPTPENREQFKIHNDVNGAIVASVEDGSPAQEAGLHAGDVIVQANGKGVNSAAAAQAFLDKDNLKHGVRLRVMSNGTAHFVFLRVDGK